jgi:endonuclease/exonuclease/phosphatase family metal-dependent hydrolase
MLRFILCLLFCPLLLVGSIQIAEAKPVKALTYNIWGLPFPIAKRMDRFPLIRKKLPSYDADIIALQEVFTNKARVTSKLKGYPFKAYGPKASFLNLSSGLIIMSKHSIIETKTIKFNKCQGWDCFANKGVLFARVLINGSELDVYATHLNAEGEDEGPRYDQLKDFIKFVKENSIGRKTIFLGDFNFIDRSFLHQMFTEELGVLDSHLEFITDNPDLSDDLITGATSSSGKRIDYVFLTPDLSVEKVEVVFKEKLYKGEQLSDHRAVLTTFDF